MNKLIKTILIFTVFIIPLFYLPFTQEQFQFNKEMLFLALMLLAGILWFGKAVKQKKLEIIRSPLDVPILLIPLVYALSTVISPDWLGSLINLNGTGLAGLTTILSLTLFYFICVNVFIPESSEDSEPVGTINSILIALIASSFIAQIIFYLSIFNVNFLPGQHHTFNTLGQSSKLMMFAALTIPIALYFLLRKQGEKVPNLKRFGTLFALLYIVFTLFTLNTINYTSGWLIAAAGSFVFLVLFTSYYAHIPVRAHRAWVPAAVLAISLISVIIKPSPLLNTCFPDSWLCVPQKFQPGIPAEVSLSKSISRKLAVRSSIDSPVNFIAGAGPNNFSAVFSKYRPEQFNNNPLWQIRFNRAANFFYETIATIGWLGFVSFILLFVFFIATAAFLLFRARDSFPLIVLIAMFAACLTGFWLIMPSLTMLMILWLIFGLTAVIGILNGPQHFSKIELSFSKSSKNALFLSFGLVFAFVLLLFFVIFMCRLYLAEFYYKNGLAALNRDEQTDESLAQARSHITKAISINQRRAEYYLEDAKVSLAQLEKKTQEQEAEKISKDQIEALLASAVNQSKKAEQLKGYSAAVWETRGLIFEAISKWIPQARVHGINAFERAIKLEPSNPILYHKLGDNQQMLWRADHSEAAAKGEKIEDFEMLDQAQKNLEKAIELKPDYVAPRLALAKLFETRGDMVLAVGALKAALMALPNLTNPEVYYELARLMYNQVLQDKGSAQEKSDEILSHLNKAIELSPNYSNALYTRSLLYRQLDKTEEAIADMQKVVELNPNHKEAKAKLDEIKRLAPAEE